MMNYQKLLREKRNSIAIISFLILLVSCEKKEIKEEYVARVNDAVLTESQLDSLLIDERFEKKFREEVIRNWVESEVILQQAIELEFDKEEEYKKLIELAKRQIAVAYLINKVIKNTPIEYNNYEVEKYFSNNRKDYVLRDDAYSLNIVVFSDSEVAFNFRKEALKTNWNYALSIFEDEESLIKSISKKFYYDYEIQPVKRLRVIKHQKIGEISIALEEEPGKFAVVQVLDRFRKNQIPRFEFIEDLVIERYLVEKKQELFHNYMDDLYSKYDVEIK